VNGWLAFLALTAISALIVRAMIAVGMMDQPDHRKLHTRPIPTGGGVGVVVAFMLAVAPVLALSQPWVLVAMALIAVVSFADDRLGFPFTIKLAAQIVAAILVVGSGFTLQPGAIGLIAAAVWLVFVTNAVNFMDGMNGLAAGTALVACLFLAGGAGGLLVVGPALALAAGLLGFLPFNFPQARIFMGDVGSQFCGFVLGVLGLVAAGSTPDWTGGIVLSMLLAGLFWDVGFTLLRRAWAGENLARAHRGHLYQLARRGGVDARVVAMLHWGFAALGGCAALAMLGTDAPFKVIFPLALLLPQLWWTIYVLRRAPPLTEP
jgi:UDP-GlcNAc:undecaprenyl-phosphate GlcNAc-1-phosphate transferase